MHKATARFQEIFGETATTHGAAGWQMNNHAFELLDSLNFDYSSDTRGHSPFLPAINGKVMRCPQLPTTLPTLDELIGVGEITANNVAKHVLNLTDNAPTFAPVYTLHAEMEGMQLLPVFDQLLQGWRTQGYRLGTSKAIFDQLDLKQLPVHTITRGSVPGRSGTLMLQGTVIN